MATNQEGKQSSARTLASSTLDYNGDLMAMCEAEGFTGTFNERMIAWANNRSGESISNINDALNTYAVSQGFANWGALNSIPASGLSNHTNALRLAAGSNSYLSRVAAGAPIDGQDWLLLSCWVYRHVVTDTVAQIFDAYNTFNVRFRSTGRVDFAVTSSAGTFAMQTDQTSHDFTTDLQAYFHFAALFDNSNTGDTMRIYHNGTRVDDFGGSTLAGTLVALSGNGLAVGNRADSPLEANNVDADLYMFQVFGGAAATSGDITVADLYNSGTPINKADDTTCIFSVNPDSTVGDDDEQGAAYWTNNNTATATTNIPS